MLAPGLADYPPAKRAILDQECAWSATAAALPQPTSANPAHLLYPEPTREPIVEVLFDGPSGWMGYTFANAWSKRIGSEDVSVWAGVQREDLPVEIAPKVKQGMVIVTTMIPGTWEFSRNGGYYPTPQRDGMLRIVSVDEYILDLTAEDGATFDFDVISRRLVQTPRPPQ